MSTVSRWFAPAVLAAGIGLAALSPVTVHAQSANDLVRVLVDVGDVVMRGNTPYYRNGDYGYNDRLIMDRDRYGRPVYYRQVQRNARYAPPYGNAYGYQRNQQQRNNGNRNVKCNKHGKCKATYYDPRHDRGDRDDDRYSQYDRNDRRWDGRRD